MQWFELMKKKEMSGQYRNNSFTEIMMLAGWRNIIVMHIQKYINLGHDLIKIKVLWEAAFLKWIVHL